MSVLNYPSVRSSTLHVDELQDAFLAWVRDPDMPDVVELGDQRVIPMAELARHQLLPPRPDPPRRRPAA